MRRPDWPERLGDTVDEWRDRPFAWGEADCFRFPLACVDAMSGSGWLAQVAEYDSKIGAYRALAARGWGNVADAFASEFEEIPPVMMKRGDLAVIEDARALCGAVCVGTMLVAMSREGLAFVPRELAVKAFKV